MRNLLLDGQTKIWQGRCAEVRGELTTEQAAQRDVSRERAMTMLTLLRHRRGVLETPYQIGAAFTPKPRVPSWTCPMQEYVDSLPFAALRRYIGALQKALHTSIARLSPLKLARERVQCNITTQYITLKGSARRESMPTLNGTWHNENTLALYGRYVLCGLIH